jgi:hypothetical protein
MRVYTMTCYMFIVSAFSWNYINNRLKERNMNNVKFDRNRLRIFIFILSHSHFFGLKKYALYKNSRSGSCVVHKIMTDLNNSFILLLCFVSELSWLTITAPFCGLTQRLMIILYRRFGTRYRSHRQGSRSPSPLGLLDFWRWDRYVVPKRR